MKRFVWLIIFLILSIPASAENVRLLSKGRYFSVYAEPGIDVHRLARIFTYRLSSIASLTSKPSSNPNVVLAQNIDSIFEEACDTLGFQLPDYHGKIKFVRNQETLNRIFNRMFNDNYHERAFYYHDHNTVYISAEDATLGMFGHEVSHAAMSHYFVVPPPPKIQEVLAGYVEFKFRKFTKQ